MVRIRLSRVGRKHLAYYKIVVTPRDEKRDSKAIEYVGHYAPHTKELKINKERVEYWLSVGAKPSKTVMTFLVKEKLLAKPKSKQVYKDKPGKKASERNGKKESKAASTNEKAKKATKEEIKEEVKEEVKEVVKEETKEEKSE